MNKRWNLIAAAAVVLLATSHAANAQSSGAPIGVQEITFEQHLGAEVPLGLSFRDETSTERPLREYFQGRPVVLVLAYYRCPMLCNQVLNGVLTAANGIELTAGEDYEIVVVSFDPTDTSQMAAAKLRNYASRYRANAAVTERDPTDGSWHKGWHFLVGSRENVARLADAVGFHYRFDKASGQYAHASGIMVTTADGRLSQYFYGIDYPTRSLRLALVDASAGKLGSIVDQVLLLCFHYDPQTGRYGLAVITLVRLGGVVTVIALIWFIVASLRRDRAARQPK
jgi:protein SCO1/2